MRVISLKRLREFWQRHPDSELQLRCWYRTALKASWRHLNEVRRDYPHADAVIAASGQPLTVFNIYGNKYRLIVNIVYQSKVICVGTVLTHAEYSKGRWKENL
jgi:mRNA interferase HigB